MSHESSSEPLGEAAARMLGETRAAVPTTGRAAHGMHQDHTHFADGVRQQVESRLRAWLDARVTEARERGPDVGLVAESIRELTLRGGKRLRAVLLGATYEACGGERGAGAVAAAGAALELFQAYLLIHDDLMDGGELRRGGPSVPAVMRKHFGGTRGDAMSVLAGDLAGAWSQALLLEVGLPPERVAGAAIELARVHEDVIAGQVLDVAGTASDARAVESMHRLKTASYTVRGPVTVGARLAGALESQVLALVAFADPLGVAFQLRDDVLGTLGDPAATGKAATDDLREGKRTALVVEALRDARAAEALDRVLGRRDASNPDLREAIARIEASGARDRVEARITELTREARAALGRVGLSETGRALLEPMIESLTERRI